jgi:TniQ
MTPGAQRTFAVRPRPTPGESTPGYLMRVAGANGFRSVPQLFTSLRVRQQSAFDELRARLCLTDQERGNLFGTLPGHWGHSDIPLGLGVSDFNQTCRRWCPACMKEGCVLQGRWGLKLVCACSVHGVWLQDACPRCDACCSWSDAVQTHCLCGASLVDADTEIADGDVLALTQLLCGDSTGAYGVPGLAALTTPAVHRLVRYLGPFHADPRPAHPGQSLDVHRMTVARALVEGAAGLLANWPARLHERIAEIQSLAPRSTSVRRTFAPLYRVLYDDLSEPSYQFLRDAFEAYLHEHWWGLVCRRNKRMQSATVEKHPRITLPQMATAAGVPESVVRHLVQAELISATSTALPSGRHSRSIHSDELHRIKVATDGALSLGQASRALELPEGRLRDLIAEGVVLPLISRQMNRGAAAWVIPNWEIERLHVRPGLAVATSDAVPLREALKYWRLRQHEGVSLVRAVIDGQVPVLAGDQDRVPIGLAMLSPAETKRWLAMCRIESGEGLSVDQAAKELGLKQQVAYDVVRAGLLTTTDAGVLGRRVTARDIEVFREGYVSLADLAREANCLPRTLLARVGVAPVCGPTVDGARQYFFRRAELLPRQAQPRAPTDSHVE